MKAFQKRSLNKAIGLALAGMAFNAAAETATGVSDLSYEKAFGGYYYAQKGYAGGLYNYAVGVSRTPGAVTSTAYGNVMAVDYAATNGFGEAGDYWTVNGTDHTFNDPMESGHVTAGVGQLSWCQAGICAGAADPSIGWNHTSQHVLFSVTTEADITISLSNSFAVEGYEAGSDHSGALASDLIPGFTLYSGVSTSGWNPVSHTFTNETDMAMKPLTHPDKSGNPVIDVPAYTDLTYLASDANVANANTISQTYHLAEGLYSLWFGGNFANVAANNSTLSCDTLGGDGNCTGFGGHGKNFQLTIETATTAPVPVPGAAWLFSGAIAGLGALGRRKKANVA